MSLIGKMLHNRYEILEKIGEGGMATVYRARCHMLNRDVAIKVLKDEFTTDAEFIKRFNVEAQSAAALTHPNIVSIYDVGTDDNMYYIVMELVKGTTLKDIIEDEGRLKWREALKTAKQVGSALQVAHKNGIIHRDIKPHNIMITKEGIAKVTDFGIAKAITNATITAYGSTIGSVHYFSPEHAKGGTTDAQSDIYSLGVVMYEMVTGRVPFDADTPVSVALKQVQEDPIPPIDIATEIPMGLNFIILKAMEKDKKLRYKDAEELLDDIEILLKDKDVDFYTLEDRLKSGVTSIIPTIDEEDDGKKKSIFERKPFLKALAVVVGIALLVLLIIYVSSFIAQKKKEQDPFIPNLAGEFEKDRMTKEEAIEELEKLGFNYEIIEEESDEVEEGYVIKQDPKYQERYRLPKGSTITIYVSTGPRKEELPTDLVGKTKKAVEDILKEKGFKYEIVEEFSDDVDKDKVIKIEPEITEENKAFSIDEVFKITVSKGSELKEVEIPNVINKKEKDAKDELEKAGFKVITRDTEVPTESNGLVMAMDPPEKSTLKQGETVTLFVNKVRDNIEGTLIVDIAKLSGYTIDPEEQDKEAEKVEVLVLADDSTVFEDSVREDETKLNVTMYSRGRSNVKVYIDGVQKYNNYVDLNEKTTWNIN